VYHLQSLINFTSSEAKRDYRGNKNITLEFKGVGQVWLLLSGLYDEKASVLSDKLGAQPMWFPGDR
jgi:hypothetical protein